MENNNLVLENQDLQNLVEIIDFGFNLIEAIKTAKQGDGVINIKDWPVLFPLVMEAGTATSGLDKIVTGYLNSTKEERTLVVNHFNDRFKLKSPIAEAVVEKVLVALVSISALFLSLED